MGNSKAVKNRPDLRAVVPASVFQLVGVFAQVKELGRETQHVDVLPAFVPDHGHARLVRIDAQIVDHFAEAIVQFTDRKPPPGRIRSCPAQQGRQGAAFEVLWSCFTTKEIEESRRQIDEFHKTVFCLSARRVCARPWVIDNERYLG